MAKKKKKKLKYSLADVVAQSDGRWPNNAGFSMADIRPMGSPTPNLRKEYPTSALAEIVARQSMSLPQDMPPPDFAAAGPAEPRPSTYEMQPPPQEYNLADIVADWTQQASPAKNRRPYGEPMGEPPPVKPPFKGLEPLYEPYSAPATGGLSPPIDDLGAVPQTMDQTLSELAPLFGASQKSGLQYSPQPPPVMPTPSAGVPPMSGFGHPPMSDIPAQKEGPTGFWGRVAESMKKGDSFGVGQEELSGGPEKLEALGKFGQALKLMTPGGMMGKFFEKTANRFQWPSDIEKNRPTELDWASREAMVPVPQENFATVESMEPAPTKTTTKPGLDKASDLYSKEDRRRRLPLDPVKDKKRIADRFDEKKDDLLRKQARATSLRTITESLGGRRPIPLKADYLLTGGPPKEDFVAEDARAQVSDIQRQIQTLEAEERDKLLGMELQGIMKDRGMNIQGDYGFTTLSKALPVIASIEAAGRKVSSEEQDKLFQIAEDFHKDKGVVKARTDLDNLREVLMMTTDTANAPAIQSAVRFMLRSAGEERMTEVDVKQMGRSFGITGGVEGIIEFIGSRRAESWVTKIKDLAKKLQEVRLQQIHRYADQRLDRIESAYGRRFPRGKLEEMFYYPQERLVYIRDYTDNTGEWVDMATAETAVKEGKAAGHDVRIER